MATPDLTRLLEAAHRTLLCERDDRQLLRQFLTNRDEAAFAALVRRYGRLVLTVCRRVLRHAQDAEDAFQATFLVLARKAAVVDPQALPTWLYAVARRTAAQARARRRNREYQVETAPHPTVLPAEPQDWRPVLDEEVSRLSDRYRMAVILCDLQGLSRREAARRLGVPEGTISSRLAAAHKLLGQRLSRRGVALSAAAITGAFAEATAYVQIPMSLAGSTGAAATLVATGQFAKVGPPVVALTKGVLHTMFLAKMKVALGAVLVLAMFGVGSLLIYGGSSPASAQATVERGKAPTVEALQEEIALLRLNLLVVLEKVHAQESEIAALRKVRYAEGGERWFLDRIQEAEIAALRKGPSIEEKVVRMWSSIPEKVVPEPSPTEQVEAALKALKAAKTPEEKHKATEALQKAVKALTEPTKEAK
jgi:RNA polymerase sigma factor (sigma-70 family)